MARSQTSPKKLPSVQEIQPSKIFCNAIVEEQADGVSPDLGAGIWLLDQKMKILWMNEVMEDIYGDLRKFQGKKCYRAFRNRNSPCPDCLPTQAFESGNIISGYISRRTKDGRKRFYQLIEAPLLDERNEVSRVMEIVLDVTEAKYLEASLRESEREHRALFEHAGTAIVVSDRKGKILRVNHQFEKLSGYSKKELEGIQTYTQFIHPKDRQRIQRYTKSRGKDRSNGKDIPTNYEFFFVDRWGKDGLLNVSVNTMPDGRQIASLIDVSDRWRLEQDIRSKEQFLANILRSSADAIVAMDPQEKIRSWNEGAKMMFGFEAKQVLEKKFSSLLLPKYRKEFQASKLDKKFHAQGYLRNLIVEAEAKDGRALILDVTRSAIFNEENEEVGSSVILRDITETRRLEQHTIQQEKMQALGELAASLAHEIKNPLNSIVINTEVLRGHLQEFQENDRVQVEKYLGFLEGEVKRLDRVIQGVLDFARPMGGKLAMIEIDEALNYVLQLVGAEARSKNIGLKRKIDPSLTLREGYVDHLKQAFLNLILNSFQAMPKGGVLTTSAYRNRRKEIIVEFSDSGLGIPPSHRSRVFDLYYSTKEKGSGLGLPLVKRTLEAHGGHIEFKSRVKKGTTFTLTLPTGD